MQNKPWHVWKLSFNWTGIKTKKRQGTERGKKGNENLHHTRLQRTATSTIHQPTRDHVRETEDLGFTPDHQHQHVISQYILPQQ